MEESMKGGGGGGGKWNRMEERMGRDVYVCEPLCWQKLTQHWKSTTLQFFKKVSEGFITNRVCRPFNQTTVLLRPLDLFHRASQGSSVGGLP